MTSDTPLVSVVILVWNGWPDVGRSVASVLRQDYAPLEIIVVDNASQDGSLARLQERYPDLRYLRNPRNLGFARGMNIGIAATRGKYVIALNQDAFLEPRFAGALVSALEEDPSLGAGSPAVKVTGVSPGPSSGEERVEIGYQLQKRMRGVAARRGADPQYVLGPSGSCPFFRRAMLEDVALGPGQYFDERYGTGGEDIDLYLRMRLRNWRCRHVPEARSEHRGSGSVGGKIRLVDKPLEYQKNVLRNRYFTILTDLPAPVIRRIFPYLIAAELAVWPYYLFKSPRTLLAVLRAWADVLRAGSYIAGKRRAVQGRIAGEGPSIMEHFVSF